MKEVPPDPFKNFKKEINAFFVKLFGGPEPFFKKVPQKTSKNLIDKEIQNDKQATLY